MVNLNRRQSKKSKKVCVGWIGQVDLKALLVSDVEPEVKVHSCNST